MKVVVIIPVYKEKPDTKELVSLKQCFKILNKHQITVVAPKNLNISYYTKVLGNNVAVEYFDEWFFKDIKGYNNLLLDIDFYKRFLKYDYVLIYQLDCFVFEDKLDYWCKLGYDYIGAPWLEKSYYKKSFQRKMFYKIKRFIKIYILNKKYSDKRILTFNVGNGGFSLRKVSKFIQVLQNTPQNIIEKFKNSNDVKSIFNEDVFWSFEAKGIIKPNYKTASKFSLDLGADIGLKINKGELPFGCHAWYKKYQYWENYITIDESPDNF